MQAADNHLKKKVIKEFGGLTAQLSISIMLHDNGSLCTLACVQQHAAGEGDVMSF